MSTPRFETLLKSGDLEQARAEAEAALARAPADRRALLALAKLAALEGDEARAESLLARAAGGTAEDEADALLVRAALLMQRGDPEAAGKLYLQIIQGEPPRAEAFYGLGFLLAEAEENAGARDALEQAVQIDPDVGVYRFQLARVLFAQGQLKEAFEHLEKSLRLNPGHVPSYVLFAVALQAGGELAAAEDILRQGLKAFPDEPHMLDALSNVLAGKGDIPGAVEAAEALARVQPNHPGAIGNLARFRMAQGKVVEALSLCQALAERGQATAQSRSVEAMIYEGMDPPNVEGAIAAWSAAMELEPEDWAPANNLGNLLMRTPARPDADKQAREALEEAHRRAPDQPEPRINLALVCAKLGDKARARELVQELLGRGPTLEPSIREQAERLLKQLG